jgi:hypothetical protein
MRLLIKIVIIVKLISWAALNAVKRPAITRVQECSKLETGVGPSIASGSHSQASALTDFRQSAKINIERVK